MKAKDIKPGEVYAIEVWRSISEDILGGNIHPFLIDRVERSPRIKQAYGPGAWGGDMRAYGRAIDPGTGKILAPVERSFALSKVIGLWDQDAYLAQVRARENREETDQIDARLGAKLCNRLADLGVGASYSSQGLLIARPTLETFARVLGETLR